MRKLSLPSLGAETAACIRQKLMWPEAYWTSGYQHRFPEGSEVETTLIAQPHGGQPSEALREQGPSFPKPFSPEGRSLNRPSARRALGESVASVAKIPKESL